MAVNRIESAGVLSDIHMGAETHSKYPNLYVSSQELIKSIRTAKAVSNPRVWFFPGDLTHRGIGEEAWKLIEVFKAADILDDEKLAIPGNHEYKTGIQQAKEVEKILEGEGNVTMVEGRVYALTLKDKIIGVAGFNGYSECAVDGNASLEDKMALYHEASRSQLADFQALFDQMNAPRNILLMHVPPPFGTKLNRVFLHPHYGEAILQKSEKISHILYGHIHEPWEEPDASSAGILHITEHTTIINTALPFTKAAGRDLITIVDLAA